MYSIIDQIPVTSNAASTKSHSYYPPSTLLDVITSICLVSCDETPLAPSSSRPSPPSFRYRKVAPPGLLLFASFPGILSAPLSYPESLLTSPISFDINIGCYRAHPSHYYCTWLYIQGMVMLLLPRGGSYWTWSPHGFPQSTTAMSFSEHPGNRY